MNMPLLQHSERDADGRLVGLVFASGTQSPAATENSWLLAVDGSDHAWRAAAAVIRLAEAAGTPSPIPHDVAALTHSQIGRPGGAEHAFQSLYDIVVRQQPEVLQ